MVENTKFYTNYFKLRISLIIIVMILLIPHTIISTYALKYYDESIVQIGLLEFFLISPILLSFSFSATFLILLINLLDYLVFKKIKNYQFSEDYDLYKWHYSKKNIPIVGKCSLCGRPNPHIMSKKNLNWNF